MRLLEINGKRGETIVEVLIAIVVLSMALGGAFAIANRSVLQTQSNHERYQAQLAINGIAEDMRLQLKDHIDAGDTRASYHYSAIDVNGNSIETAPPTTAIVTDASSMIVADAEIIITELDAAGVVTGGGGGITSKTFRIEATWPGLNRDEERVELLYGL